MSHRKQTPWWFSSNPDLLPVDWEKLEAIIGREITVRERHYIWFRLKTYAVTRLGEIQNPTPSELEAEIENVFRCLNGIKNLCVKSENNSHRTIRLMTGNRKHLFNWESLYRSLLELESRLNEARNNFRKWKKSEHSNIKVFHPFNDFVLSQFCFFTNAGIKATASKNINRETSKFVDWCYTLIGSCPSDARQHFQSKITFSSAIADIIAKHKREPESRSAIVLVGEIKTFLIDKPPTNPVWFFDQLSGQCLPLLPASGGARTEDEK